MSTLAAGLAPHQRDLTTTTTTTTTNAWPALVASTVKRTATTIVVVSLGKLFAVMDLPCGTRRTTNHVKNIVRNTEAPAALKPAENTGKTSEITKANAVPTASLTKIAVRSKEEPVVLTASS